MVKKLFNIGSKQNTKLVSVRSFINVQEDGIDRFTTDHECIDLYFYNHLKRYGWIFPLRKAINIGVYNIDTNTKNKYLLQKIALKNFKIPKESIRSSKIEGFPIPVTKLPKRFSKENVFLIGDAAGLVDPVSGEGIHYAIRSGKIVADTILKAYSSNLNDNLDYSYRYKIEKDIIPDLFISYKLKNFLELFFTGNQNLLFKIIKRNPFIFNYVQEIAIKSSYYDIYKYVLNNIFKITIDTIKGGSTIPRFCISK